MDRTRLLLCGLLVSITLHAQAMRGKHKLYRTPPSLVHKRKDKREELGPANVRADAVDKLLDTVEDATARLLDLGATYAEFIADDSAFTGFIAFLDSETGEGISASDILPAEVEAIEKVYRSSIRAIEVSRDRAEVFDNDISLLKHWRRLTQMKEFQIPECTDLNNAALLNAYNMEIALSRLEIINRGYSFAFESFITNVYQDWLTCLLSEIAELKQDPNFSGFECEAGVAAQMKQVYFHISLVLGKLEVAGAKIDDTLATFKTAIEGAGDDCYNTGRMLKAVNALISVGVSRRENEVAVVEMNQSFFDAYQRWLDFFTTTKREVANNKAELVGLLKKLLDEKATHPFPFPTFPLKNEE